MGIHQAPVRLMRTHHRRMPLPASHLATTLQCMFTHHRLGMARLLAMLSPMRHHRVMDLRVTDLRRDMALLQEAPVSMDAFLGV